MRNTSCRRFFSAMLILLLFPFSFLGFFSRSSFALLHLQMRISECSTGWVSSSHVLVWFRSLGKEISSNSNSISILSKWSNTCQRLTSVQYRPSTPPG
ncbi:hypothetical protein F4810DRAFT_690893 [Camillea tinctor]|nr:hypothetical protein F4810DRAFT_690893 [Camillea tinctor]